MPERTLQRHHIPRILVAEEQLPFGVADVAQGEREHLAEFLDRVDVQPLARLLGEVVEVGLVRPSG